MRARDLRPMWAMVGVGTGYLAAAFAGRALAPAAAPAPFWLANGVLLAALLRADARHWPGLAVGSFAASTVANAWLDRPMLLNLATWMGNVGECVAAAALLRRVGRRDLDLGRLADVAAFAAAVVGCTALGAGIGAVATVAWEGAQVGAAWRSWWAADLLGALTVAPVIVAFPRLRDGWHALRASPECAAFGAVLAAAVAATALAPAAGVDAEDVIQPFMVPLLGWSALRLGVSGTSWAVLVLSLLAVRNQAAGAGGAITVGSWPERAAAVHVVLGGLAVTFLALSAGLQERRVSAERLARRERGRQAFLAEMTHELRNLLNVIFAQLAAGRARDAAGVLPAGAAQAIDRAARQILRVADGVLDVGRIEAGPADVRWERLWWPAAWRDLQVECQVLPRSAAVALEWKAPAPDALVHVDRRRLDAVVRNLVGNALKYTERGHVRVESRVRGTTLELLVRDTGLGIPLDEQERVFELYHRVRRDVARGRAGSGVGLFVVRQYVEQLGGRVDLESAPGRGTGVMVALPGVVREAGASARTSGAAPA